MFLTWHRFAFVVMLICYTSKLCHSRDTLICCRYQRVKLQPGEISRRNCDNYDRQYQMLNLQTSTESSIDESGAIFFPQAVNGERTTQLEFTHMAALGFENNGLIDWRCGGSLISEKYVLTAAHCPHVVNETVNWVRLGDIFLQHSGDSPRPDDYEIIRIIKHPQYNRRKKHNDIALLELERNVTFTLKVSPICLHLGGKINEGLIATGWGATSYGGHQSEHLLKVYLNFFNFSRCEKLYKTKEVNRTTQMCVGSIARKIMDTCQGDSGGPLQVLKPLPAINRYKLVGITSYGLGCGNQNTPGIYTKVSHYVPWIESIVWPNKTFETVAVLYPNPTGRGALQPNFYKAQNIWS